VIDLRRAAGLRSTGSAVKIVNPEQKIDLIVARTAKDRWIALNRSCTHGGAQVVYNHRRQSAQCTSLGHSEFDLQGTVLRGPAPRPLPVHEVRRTGNQLRISREAAS
jgi:Rieske Fe-S protein